ncbi:MAG TPA: dihydrodipicolinate synthase family protein [Blastocatellia bacterium]|jgi:4-hydroxy-2-oxoglutarate aldolase
MRDFHLNGILPPLTTPFDEGGDVDYEALRANIKRYNVAGLAGYVALGSNGEAVHLTQDERARVIETIRRHASPAHVVIAGVNEFSTRAAINGARNAASAGADATLVITPYFYKSQMTQGLLAGFFAEVADASPIPVLVYNVPQNTGVVIEPATIARLAAHENIIGVKDSSGNMGAICETLRLAPAEFKVMVGNGGILYPSLLMGATGAILGVACAAPRACVEVYEAARAGDHARARELQNRISPLSHIVTAGLGVPGLKAAMNMTGLRGGVARPPLAPLSDSEAARVKAVVRETGLFPDFE